MATRENQGLHIAVIILSILTLAMFVGMFVFRSKYLTQYARAETAETRSGQLQQQQAQAQEEANEIKRIAGFADTDTLDVVREALKADMDKYAIPDDADSRRYRVVLARFADENKKLVGLIDARTVEAKTLQDRLLAVEAQKDKQVQELQAKMDQVSQDIAEQRQKFDDEYARINGEKEGIQKQMDELRATHEKAIGDLEREKEQLENQIATLTLSIDKLRLGVPNPDQFAQPADGQVTWVDQRRGTVWVNIGAEDGLRPQVTFAVAEAGLEDAAEAEKKGSIEITEILGPHMAAARITEDDPTNPLLPQDRIFSQVWDRGRQVGFGIAGVIDLDKNGVDDLAKLKAIIAANGGVVDAAPDETGKKEGELKVSTRYLILGEYPNDARLGVLRTSWGELSTEAESLGIQTIALDEFLALIGWRSEARSVNLGPGARASDFPPTARTQEMPRKTGRPTGIFKPRLPNTTY
jgi:hypothetical protein